MNKILSIESIYVGFGVKPVLSKLKTRENSKEREFRSSAESFFIKLVEKFVEKGPLKYKVVVG